VTDSVDYRERLWPTPWLYIIFLLLFPGIILTTMPINIMFGIVAAPIVYALVMGVITLTSPIVEVAQNTLYAGRANLPLEHVGSVTVLNRNQLTLAIGREADARAFLLIRGWIHTAVKIEVTDPNDPAPYWIVATRHAEQLKQALAASKTAAS
jgi:hypothetical protein